MSTKTWKFTDVDEAIYKREITIQPEDVGGRAEGYSVSKHTLRGGLTEGVDVVHVDNGACSCTLLPSRGMGIWKAWMGDLEIGWKSPILGPVNPQFVPTAEPSGLGWLDGFDELLARCGLESNGAPEFDSAGQLAWPLHGQIQNRPAHHVEVEIDGDAGEIHVHGEVDESRFLIKQLRLRSSLHTQVGEPGFHIRDEVQNVSGRPSEMQLLYHMNFGTPLLGEGARFVAPVKTVVPRDARAAEGIDNWSVYGPPEDGFAEQVYFMEMASDAAGHTLALLVEAGQQRAVGIHYQPSQLPCFTLWKNTAALADGYVTGLEPGTNFPNVRSFESEQGRVAQMPPGGRFVFDLALEIYPDAAAVAEAIQRVADMQAGEPRVYKQPQPGWSPV